MMAMKTSRLDEFPWDHVKKLCEEPVKESLSKERLEAFGARNFCSEWKESMRKTGQFVAKNFVRVPDAEFPLFKEPTFPSSGLSITKELKRLQLAGPMKDCRQIRHHWIEFENILSVLAGNPGSGIKSGKPDPIILQGRPVFIGGRMKNLATCWMKESQERIFSVFRFNNLILLREQITTPWKWEEGHAFESLFKKSNQGEFCTISRGQIGGKTVFICGEVDAVDKDNRLVEIKMTDPRVTKRITLHQAWFQTFISGVEVVKYGVLNKNGNVTGVREINAQEMLQKDFDKQRAELHFGVLDTVLTFLEKTVDSMQMYYLHLPKESDEVFLYKQKKAEFDCQRGPPKEFAWYFHSHE